MELELPYIYIYTYIVSDVVGRRGRDRMINLQLLVQLVSITTTVVSSDPIHGKVYSIKHYVINYVNDLRHVDGCFRFHRFLTPIKLTATI